MRIFSIIVATLSLGTGLGCLAVVSKYRNLYHDMNLAVSLPTLVQALLKTSGLMPGGFFFAFAALLLTLVCCKQNKSAFYLAIPTLVCIILSLIVLPVALSKPIIDMADTEAEDVPAEMKKVQPDETSTE